MTKWVAGIAIMLWFILVIASCSGVKSKESRTIVEHDFTQQEDGDCR